MQNGTPQESQWGPAYSVGHPVLDQHHRHLFALCKRAVHSAEKSQDSEGFSWIINDIFQFAMKHFELEEKILREHQFADMERHANDHSNFVMQMSIFFDSAMRGALDKREVANYVWNWWHSHVLIEDMRYRPLLAA